MNTILNNNINIIFSSLINQKNMYFIYLSQKFEHLYSSLNSYFLINSLKAFTKLHYHVVFYLFKKCASFQICKKNYLFVKNKYHYICLYTKTIQFKYIHTINLASYNTINTFYLTIKITILLKLFHSMVIFLINNIYYFITL